MSDSAGIWWAELCFLRSLSLSRNSTFDLMAPKAFRTILQYNMAHFQIIPPYSCKITAYLFTSSIGSAFISILQRAKWSFTLVQPFFIKFNFNFKYYRLVRVLLQNPKMGKLCNYISHSYFRQSLLENAFPARTERSSPLVF